MTYHDKRFLIFSAWSCFLFFIIFGTSFGVLGQNIPPYDGNYPTADLAAHFREHQNTLRVAYGVGMLGAVFYVTWSVGLFEIMRRMEAPGSMLSYLQLFCGAVTFIVPSVACLFWLTAAFRPETDPNIIQLLFDMGWLFIDMMFPVTSVQYISIGMLALRDKRSVPLFPKWVAWLGIWIAIEFLVELIMPFFRSGPFSWSGLFGYWIPFGGALVWQVSVAIYTLKAIPRLEAEALDGAATAAC